MKDITFILPGGERVTKRKPDDRVYTRGMRVTSSRGRFYVGSVNEAGDQVTLSNEKPAASFQICMPGANRPSTV